jgi:hypothetical protein
LKYYQFNDNYTADTVMKLYLEHDMIKYSDIATNFANPRDLNTVIDLGECPIASIYNKENKKDLESQVNNLSNPTANFFSKTKKDKNASSSDLNFLPPRPNKFLDVVTYSECSPNFNVREDQIPEETLKLTDADREEFLLTVSKVNELLKPLRGKVASQDRFLLLYLVFGMVIAATLGVV